MFNNRNNYPHYLNYKKLLEQATFCPFQGKKGSIYYQGEKDLVNTSDFVYKNNSLEFDIRGDNYSSIKGNILDNDPLFLKDSANLPTIVEIGFDKKKVAHYNVLTINAKTNNQIVAFNIGDDYKGGSGYLNIKKSSDSYIDFNGNIITPSIINKFSEPYYNLKLQSSQKDISNAKATASQILRTQVMYDNTFRNEIMSEAAITLEPNKIHSFRHKNEGKLQYEMNFYLKSIDTSSNLVHNEYQGILSETNEIPFISLISDSSNNQTDSINFYKNINIIKDNNDISQNIYIDSKGFIGMGISNPRAIIDISREGVIIFPTNSNNLNDNINGAVRYNPIKRNFEGYKSGRWGTLGGVDDSSGTFISAVDISDGEINSELQFYTSGEERMRIDKSGNIIVTSGHLDISQVNYYTYTNIKNDLIIKDNIIEIGYDDASNNDLNKGIIFSLSLIHI